MTIIDEYILLGLVAIIVLGILAQWLSWRLRRSSVILFIFFGIIVGPLAGIIQPDQLFGHLLLPFVSLSVAVILFEGGLGLNLKELRAIGKTLKTSLPIAATAPTHRQKSKVLSCSCKVSLLMPQFYQQPNKKSGTT